MNTKMLPAMIFALCAMSGVIGYLLGRRKTSRESYDKNYDFNNDFPDLDGVDIADEILGKAQTPEE